MCRDKFLYGLTQHLLISRHKKIPTIAEKTMYFQKNILQCLNDMNVTLWCFYFDVFINILGVYA